MNNTGEIQTLLTALQHPSSAEQGQAAYRLAEIGDAAVIPAIVACEFFCSPEHDGFIEYGMPSPLDVFARRYGRQMIQPLLDLFRRPSVLNGLSVTYVFTAFVTIGADAVEPLLAWLETCDTVYIDYLAETLGKIGDRRAVGPLRQKLLTQPTDTVLLALVRLGDAPLDELVSLATSDRYQMRIFAMKGLARLDISNDAVDAAVIRALKDDVWLVVDYAVPLAGQLRIVAAVERLIPLLSDRTYTRAAVYALDRIDIPEARHALAAWKASQP